MQPAEGESTPPLTWQQLSEYLDRALELDEPARSRWLLELKQSEPGVAAKLAELLAPDSRHGFSRFLAGDTPLPAPESVAASLVGRAVGPYVIEAQIGQGGMGSVWLARRADGRYEGKVAVKFVHAMWIGREGEQRFRQEGNVLGQLDHPNIARLIDAGVLDGIQPYLVIEYVEGEPIDAYCARHSLDTADRVKLFLDVMAAVTHAHSHLIIHRDIKPANIFVTQAGAVKLLDFGIAKFLDDKDASFTRSGATALTPQYAAPEQLLGQPVTTATDVYSLGLVLYLLLTGRHPIASDTLSNAALLQAVLTEDPARPSTVGELPTVRRRSLTGDLDTIIGKTLKKSPAERYPTSEAFAADLRSFLNHEPISARRDSFTYVVGKLVRRHRLQVGAASMTLLALIAGIVGTTLQANEARRQRAIAVAQRDRAQNLLARNGAIFDFVDMMLTQSVPSGEAEMIQRMLARGITFAPLASAGQPDREAEILRVLASYYIDLDDPQKAVPLLEKALALVGERGDPSLRARLSCSRAYGLSLLGRPEEAIKLVETWIKRPDVDGTVAATCMQTRAIFAQNVVNAGQANEYADMAIKRAATADPPDAALQAALLGDKGFALHLAGNNAEADSYYAAAIDRLEKMGLREHKEARRLLGDWGIVAYGSGDIKRGLDLCENLVRIEERLAGTEPVPPSVIANYAFGLAVMARYDEALAQYDRTLLAGEQTGFIAAQAYALIGRAGVYADRGESKKAEENLKRARTLSEGKIPESHPLQIRAALIEAQVDAAEGRSQQALDLLNHAVDLLKANGVSHASMADAFRHRAEIEAALGNSKAAQQDAHDAVRIAASLQGGKRYSFDTGDAYLSLGKVLRGSGNPDGARDALKTAVEHLSNTAGDAHPDTQTARSLLARL